MIFISEFVTHSWWIYNFNIIGELDVMVIILQNAHIKQLFFFKFCPFFRCTLVCFGLVNLNFFILFHYILVYYIYTRRIVKYLKRRKSTKKFNPKFFLLFIYSFSTITKYRLKNYALFIFSCWVIRFVHD